MDKKYQVFISSTYEDLKQERDQAIKAVLEMGHIPVGMEMFSAADEEQWQLIAKQIELSDYYLVIVAHRYGSETPEGISYTEKEYDFAKACGVPTLGFIIDDKASWPTDKVDRDRKKVASLTKFQEKVKSKLVHFWSTKEDLHGKVSISLIKAMTTNPRVGWSRADEVISPDVTKELSRLSKENSILRTENQIMATRQAEAADEVKEVVGILHANVRTLKIRSENSFATAEKHTRSLLDLFLAAAPNLISESTTLGIAQNIAYSIVSGKHHKNWPFGKINTEKLIADFAALDLLETSKKKHPVSDKQAYWSLTKVGRQVQKRSLRIQLEKGISSTGDSIDEEDL